jgi:extracellular elastinolytic metalloproteinase
VHENIKNQGKAHFVEPIFYLNVYIWCNKKHKPCFNLINFLIMKKKFLRILLILFIPWIGFSQTNKEVSAETLIQEHLSISANKSAAQSISYEISRDFVEPDTKIRRIYAQQQVNGISVKGAVLNLNYAVNGRKAIVDSFKKMNVNSSSPSIIAERALRNAMINLGDFNANSALVKKDVSNNPQQEITFEKGNIAADDFKARLIYLLDEANSNKGKLTWETQLYTKDRQNYWLVYVDATNGEIISKQDLVLHCSFGGLEYDFSEVESKLHKQHEQQTHLHSTLETENKNEALKNKSTFGSLKESMLALAVDHSFKVLALPSESPIDLDFTAENPSTQTMVSVLANGDAVASPYGWTKTTGAEIQDTRGNNVYSFYDASPGPLGGAPVGATPPTTIGVGVGSTWDYVWDLTQEPGYISPTTPNNEFPNRTAAIVSLFYMNNMMHDVFYGFGFNEENRNFQEVNSFPEEGIADRGGLGNDSVLAQAQDGGGTNNANMLTLADGTNGQMQMYLWTAAVAADIVYIDQNGYDDDYNVDGGIQYLAVQGSFPGGPQADTDLSRERVGDYVIVEGNSQFGSTPGGSEGCGLTDASGTGLPYDNQLEVEGNIAIIDRGACSFVEKVVSAQLSGAIAAIVINNVPGSGPVGMGGSDTQSYSIDIPSVMIGYADGKELKAAIIAAKANGETISGKLFLEGGTVPARDGSLDNGVIAHEYGHGISTRLSIRAAGGLGTLGGNEQGGEGWSDFWGLYTTLRTNDLTAPTAEHPNGALPSRGIGNYVTFKAPDAQGIRPRPYSIDPEINGYTYAGSVNGSGLSSPEITVPHGVGFVWCSMLYDVFQEFVDVYGFNDDIYETGLNLDLNDPAHSGGNNVFNRLIIEGLKIQPASGSFADQRDAILAADALLFPSDDCGGSLHFKIIWEGFAKRGLGFREDGDYGTNALGDETDNFGIPPACGGSAAPSIAVTHSAPYLIGSGGNIEYTIKVLVTGGTATDLVIVNQLPTGDNLTFVSATGDISPNASNELIWNVGDALSGSSIEKIVTIKTSETPFTTINSLFEMESDNTNVTASSGVGVFAGSAGDKWALNTGSSYRGNKSWFVKDPGSFSEQFLAFTLNETTVADEELVFFHRFATEAGYDGGVVEYTVGGGVWVKIAKSDFTKNGYNDVIAPGNNTQITGDAFGGSSDGYLQSIANLPAGVTAVRFHFAADVGTAGTGWWIDDLMVGNTPTYAFSDVEATSTLVVQTTSAGNTVIDNDFATSLIISSNALAVDDIEDLLASKVSLIPNPAHGKVSVVWSDNIRQPFKVEMVTLDGKRINVWNVKENTEKFDINLEQYAQGFYILKIQRNDRVTFKKLIVN